MPRHYSSHRIVCWRVSRWCNRACTFCLSRSGPRFSPQMLDPRGVLSRFVELGVEKVTYSGGEPSQVADIGRALEIGADLGLTQVLTSNGDFLDPPPTWLAHLEYLKLSVYGHERLHDSLMGAGHYRSLLRICRRLTRQATTVGINYMLTPLSEADVAATLGDWHDAGANDVMFQTYIENGRRRIDARYRLPDANSVVSSLRRHVPLAGLHFPGGVKVQNYAVSDWYVVMTEDGVMTLPQAGGAPDWLLGRLHDTLLTLPDDSRLPAAEALDRVWRTRFATDAIVVLA